MALVQFNIGWNYPDPPGGAGNDPVAGDKWKIFLDPDLFSSDVSVPIIGEYVETLPADSCNECAGIVTYRVEVDDSAFPTGRTQLTACDVQSVECYTCEDQLISERNLKLFAQAEVDTFKAVIATLPDSLFTETFNTSQMTTAGFWSLFSGDRYWVANNGDQPFPLF